MMCFIAFVALFSTSVYGFDEGLYQKYFPTSNGDKFSDLVLQPRGVCEDKREERIVVSLTSYPARMTHTWLAVESLLRQSLKPDAILLWLSKEQFQYYELDDVYRLQQKRGLEIHWCEDLKSYKKLIPLVQTYDFSHSVVITTDDDMCYEPDMVKHLYTHHLENRDCVQAVSAKKISIKNSELEHESRWSIENSYFLKSNINENFSGVVTGAFGVLYPFHFLEHLSFHCNTSEIMNLAPKHDDAYFSSVALSLGMPIQVSKRKEGQMMTQYLPSYQVSPLFMYNRKNNDEKSFEQILNCFKHFNIFEKLSMLSPDNILGYQIKKRDESTLYARAFKGQSPVAFFQGKPVDTWLAHFSSIDFDSNMDPSLMEFIISKTRDIIEGVDSVFANAFLRGVDQEGLTKALVAVVQSSYAQSLLNSQVLMNKAIEELSGLPSDLLGKMQPPLQALYSLAIPIVRSLVQLASQRAHIPLILSLQPRVLQGQMVDYEILFSENVTGVMKDASDFLVEPLDVTASLFSVTGIGNRYSVHLGSLAGVGKLQLSLKKSNNLQIKNSRNVPVSSGFEGASIHVDVSQNFDLKQDDQDNILSVQGDVVENLDMGEGQDSVYFNLEPNRKASQPLTMTTLKNVENVFIANGYIGNLLFKEGTHVQVNFSLASFFLVPENLSLLISCGATGASLFVKNLSDIDTLRGVNKGSVQAAMVSLLLDNAQILGAAPDIDPSLGFRVFNVSSKPVTETSEISNSVVSVLSTGTPSKEEMTYVVQHLSQQISLGIIPPQNIAGLINGISSGLDFSNTQTKKTAQTFLVSFMDTVLVPKNSRSEDHESILRSVLSLSSKIFIK